MRTKAKLVRRLLLSAVAAVSLTSCGALWSVTDDSYMYPSGYYYNYGYGPAQPPIVGNGPGSIYPGTPPPPPPVSVPAPPPNNNPSYGKPGNNGNGPQNPIPNLPPTGNNNNQGGYRPALSGGGNNNNGGGNSGGTPPNYGRH